MFLARALEDEEEYDDEQHVIVVISKLLCNREYYFSLCLSVSFIMKYYLLRVCVCCYVRDTKETFFFLTTIANVSLEFRILYAREKSTKCVRYLAREDINLWRRVHKEWFRVRESHTFSFLRSHFLFADN